MCFEVNAQAPVLGLLPAQTGLIGANPDRGHQSFFFYGNLG